MARWAVDLGNPTKTAYALKLTSNLVKELENTEQATIKFTRENSAILTVNGLSYPLNATILNATENFYAMQENREPSLLSAVGKVSKKMTANEQATAQYVTEKCNNVLPKDKKTTFLTTTTNRGKMQSTHLSALPSNTTVNKTPLEKKKTKFLNVGDGTEDAQQVLANQNRFEREKIQSSFIEKIIAKGPDNQSKKPSNSQESEIDSSFLNKKRPLQQEETNQSLKRIKPNHLIDPIEDKSPSMQDDNHPQKKTIKLKVGGSTNNENDLIIAKENTMANEQSHSIQDIDHQRVNKSNQINNQSRTQTKIKLKIAPTYEHDMKQIKHFHFTPVNTAELLVNYPWPDITLDTFESSKIEYEKINAVHLTIYNELQTFKKHVNLLGDYLKSENGKGINIEKCEEIKRAIKLFYDQKKHTVNKLREEYKTIRISLLDLRNRLSTFMTNYLAK